MRRPRPRTLLTWALALAALAAVFSAYLDPHMAADLASRAWAACFG